MEQVGDDTDDHNSPLHSPITSDNETGSDNLYPREAVPEVLPNINGNVHQSPRRSPRRPIILVTLDDGRKIAIPQNLIDELAVATRGRSSSSPYSHVIPVDASFGCVELVVAGAKKGICFIAHI